MNLLLNVGHGIGDALYCIRLAHLLYKKHNCSDNMYMFGRPRTLEQLTNRVQGVNFITYNGVTHKALKAKKCIFINVRADKSGRLNINTQRSWYTRNDLTPTTWASHVRIKRNTVKELELERLLKLQDRFYLRNSEMNYKHVEGIPVPDDGTQIIDMKPLKGFSIFDWCSVIEKATSIYTMDSSTSLVTEVLSCNKTLEYEELVCVVRRPSVDWVDHLYERLNWKFILKDNL